MLKYVDAGGLGYVAIDALTKIAAEPAHCVPVLCRVLKKRSDTELAMGRQTGDLGHNFPDVRHLEDCRNVRRAILLALTHFGTNAEAATPLLIDELTNCMTRIDQRSSEEGRSYRDFVPVEKANLLYTAEALCRVNPHESYKIVPFLTKILREEEFLTRATVLGITDSSTAPRKYVTPTGRARAAKCLKEIGSDQAVSALAKFAKDDDADVAEIARQAMKR